MSWALPAVDFASLFVQGARGVSLVCALRGLPFVVNACASKSRSPSYKSAAVLLYLVVVVAAFVIRSDLSLLWCLLGSIFYLCCGCLIPTCTRLLRDQRVTKAGLFATFALGFVLIPGALVPGIAAGTFLVLGWELLLSAYSYCHDAARGREDPSLADCLFFLFVDPTLTYASRSRSLREPHRGPRFWGLRRTLWGIATMLVASALLHPAYRALSGFRGALSLNTPWSLLHACAFGVLRFFADYAAHSGLASIQIGLMQHSGYAVPERYRRPFLAKNPIDFWRRWNTYVAAWLRQYVFVPTVRRLKSRALPGPLLGIAVLVTVVASGLLHDGYGYAGDHVYGTLALQFFVANGLAILAWSAAGRLLGGAAGAGKWRAVTSLMSRLLFASGLLGACLAWG